MCSSSNGRQDNDVMWAYKLQWPAIIPETQRWTSTFTVQKVRFDSAATCWQGGKHHLTRHHDQAQAESF